MDSSHEVLARFRGDHGGFVAEDTEIAVWSARTGKGATRADLPDPVRFVFGLDPRSSCGEVTA